MGRIDDALRGRPAGELAAGPLPAFDLAEGVGHVDLGPTGGVEGEVGDGIAAVVEYELFGGHLFWGL